jgi:hypothetical protein
VCSPMAFMAYSASSTTYLYRDREMISTLLVVHVWTAYSWLILKLIQNADTWSALAFSLGLVLCYVI